METQHGVQFRTSEKVGILLILIVSFAFCMCGSSPSSEVARSEPNSKSNNLKVSNFCSFKKYIVKSYFEKYDSFVESRFEDLLADELLYTCELLPNNLNALLRVSVPNRLLIGEGSHRHLHSAIRLHVQSESINQLPAHFCKVIVIERLPSGVFADPFELQQFLRRGVFTDVAVFGDTNLELPSIASNRSVVEMHMNVSSSFGQTNELDISIDLPLHARYQPLGESGYSEVEFGPPDVFVQCSMERNKNNQCCIFEPGIDSVDTKTSAVIWRIPSGKRRHTGVVSVVTFVTAFISTLVIVLTSMFYLDINCAKTLKLS
ncbi:phosphatidylinositol-glycan biosynthesis class X protein [Manihot esculenta]|uniref:Phosphatidylinositol-glycan biosynthesis class X protein n=1 Tax=Manihot esculenta TaxID=3983 RepID=A0A2C9WGB1_MANES|nr:phosphatidylinositol-glycan biosynthesis class X protein [Manihot esculenta]OAY58999.1 hypothetical protein MANES_02G223400v8 [Manihot esculenta]